MSSFFEPPPKDRRGGARLRTVVVIHAAISYFCLAVSAILGDPAFIVLTGMSAVIATLGLVRGWLGS